MSQTIQPLPSAASTTPRPPQLHAAALVSLWCDLALKVAESNAHRLPDAQSLFEQQLLVEDEIARSHPEYDERMTELLVWAHRPQQLGGGGEPAAGSGAATWPERAESSVRDGVVGA